MVVKKTRLATLASSCSNLLLLGAQLLTPSSACLPTYLTHFSQASFYYLSSPVSSPDGEHSPYGKFFASCSTGRTGLAFHALQIMIYGSNFPTVTAPVLSWVTGRQQSPAAAASGLPHTQQHSSHVLSSEQ